MKAKRRVPNLNNSSTADISFMLLIFFLITSSMGNDKGLTRRLPPPVDEKQEQKALDIKQRDLLNIKINARGEVMCGEDIVDGKELRKRVKTFIENKENNPNLPEKQQTDIPLLGGKCMVTRNHVISVQTSRETSYEAYFKVQNDIVSVYAELRNTLAKKHFGRTYASCSAEEQKAIREFYPQKISEAEPYNKGGE